MELGCVKPQSIASAVFAVGLLSGCGNVYEDVNIGSWHKAGSSQIPPSSDDMKIEVTPVRSGSGPRVQAGDLVKLSVVVTTDSQNLGRQVRMASPKTVWLWTGTEPNPQTFVEEGKWGSLGSFVIRRALVGKNVGDQFKIRISEISRFSRAYIPVYGFYNRYGGNSTLVDGDQYPSLSVAERAPSFERTSELEIVATCPGELYRRTADVTQWGLWPGWGGTKTRTFRKGTLRWSALSARCPPPDGNVPFEVGPLYVGAPHDDSHLQNWQMTYRRARPPEKFPNEYEPHKTPTP